MTSFGLLLCAGAAAQSTDELGAALGAVGGTVVVGAFDAATAGALRRLDADRKDLTLTVISLLPSDDPRAVLSAVASSVGTRCTATVEPVNWTITVLGGCPTPAVTEAQPSTEVKQPIVSTPDALPMVATENRAAGLPTLEFLAGLPGWEDRRAVLVAAMDSVADSDAAKLTSAVSVAKGLAESNRNDPTVVRLFLAAAYSDDAETRKQAVEAARSNGDPPLEPRAISAPARSTATPTGFTETPELARSLATYKARHLHIDSFSRADSFTTYQTVPVTGAVYGTATIPVNTVQVTSGWTVYRGAQPLSVKEFAQAVGDNRMLDTLRRRDRRTGQWLAGTWIASGVTCAFAYSAVSRDDRYAVGATCGLAGAALFGTTLGIPLGTQIRRSFVSSRYTQDSATSLIEAYNDAVRQELGLTAAETQPVDIQ